MRIENGAVPEELFRYFGLVVYDEVHRSEPRSFHSLLLPSMEIALG
jgi:superfamily II DNA or RNA helicase